MTTINRSDVIDDIKLTTRKSLFTNNRAEVGLRYITDGYILFDREAVIPKYADLARRMASREEDRYGGYTPRLVTQKNIDPLLEKGLMPAVFEGYIEATDETDSHTKKKYPLALFTNPKTGKTYACQGRLFRLVQALVQPDEYLLDIGVNWHGIYCRIGGSIVGIVAGFLIGDSPLQIKEDAVDQAA